MVNLHLFMSMANPETVNLYNLKQAQKGNYTSNFKYLLVDSVLNVLLTCLLLL